MSSVTLTSNVFLLCCSYAALIDGNCVCMSEEPDDSTCTNSLSDDLKVYYEFTTLTVPDDFNITVSQLSNMGLYFISLSVTCFCISLSQ